MYDGNLDPISDQLLLSLPHFPIRRIDAGEVGFFRKLLVYKDLEHSGGAPRDTTPLITTT